jgi:DNA invertase Pin-like site-specific DNA recombinase
MKQAVIYTRFSPRPKAHDCISCEFQEQKAREYCEYHGIDILAVYQDKSLSGKRADNRPGLQEALVHVCKERGVLVVYALSRLARSTKDAIIISETLEKQGADLVIVTQQIDTSTPLGRAFFKMIAVIAELERETTAERTRRILKYMQNNGFRVAGEAPYGYKFDPNDAKRILPNQDEINIINLCTRLYEQGKSLTMIMNYLEENGYKPRGKRWYVMSIKRIVEKYRGA